MVDITSLGNAVIDGDARAARLLTEQALASGVDPKALVSGCLIPAMDEVGRRFANNDYFVPELLISARAMRTALELLRPRLALGDAAITGTAVIGTVKGDLHDIGKGLVSAMLEGGGFTVIDLGIDVPADAFVAAVRTHRPQVLCLSALLTTTMPAMRDVIAALIASDLRSQVKILVGGAPVSQRFADEIGADGYAGDAPAAAAMAKRWAATVG